MDAATGAVLWSGDGGDGMNDLISRQQTLKALRKLFKESNYKREYFNAIDAVEDVPAEEPKKGRWVPVTNGRGGNECSVCHSYAPSYKNGDEHTSAYCPNCGAKMEIRE